MFNEKVFKAISDKSRRKIITLLKENDLTAGEIAAHFEMTKPSISGHLNILKNADLIYSEKQGLYVKYFLNTSIFEEVLSYFIDLFGSQKEAK